MTLYMESGEGFESWKTHRPMRREGFHISAEKAATGFVPVENSEQGGAGVATRWACDAGPGSTARGPT